MQSKINLSFSHDEKCRFVKVEDISMQMKEKKDVGEKNDQINRQKNIKNMIIMFDNSFFMV